MDHVNHFLSKHPSDYDHGFVRPRLVLRSGFVISVQASRGHQCEPKAHRAERYSHVEVYVPEEIDREYRFVEDWYSYGDDPDHKRPQLFTYVPVNLVNRLIEDHGGISHTQEA